MAKDLLVEIGTEELPAGFAPRALTSFEEVLRKKLANQRLSFTNIRTLGTPRRLTFIVEGLEEKQSDTVIEARGPQTRAAYDAEGRPTRALTGFAASQGVKLSEIKTVKTDKGEYVCATRKIKGVKTEKVLAEILTEVVSHECSPKPMRWGANEISFSRPIHWLLALFGGKTVKFDYGHIKSAPYTYGHRFLRPASVKARSARPRALKVSGVDSYLDTLRENFVIVDPEERKRLISEGLAASAAEASGTVVPDEPLLNEVAFLVEYPVVVRGSFSDEFLEMPRDIIVNAMREHQRYFSVVDAEGRLRPCFLTVSNTLATDMDVVRRGNERVLRARLNDAKFYYELDLNTPQSERVEKLKGVVFQAKLGTSYEKVERFTELALFIGEKAGFSGPSQPDELPHDYITDQMNPASYDSKSVDPGFYSRLVLGRAAMLCKSDLVSGMVGEFPKLQGIMGGIYARKAGEVEAVCAAIYEHYLPQVSGGELPASVPGAVISIADKLDTIAGCFGIGLVPTGAQDPYALRRGALGIIAIIQDKGLKLSLDVLVEKALEILGTKLTRDKAEVGQAVLDFFKERLRNQLLTQGLSFDVTDAVLSAPWYDIVDAVARVEALEKFKRHPSCESLVVAFKRVSNILKGVETGGAKPDPALFTESYEESLYRTGANIAPVIEAHWANGEYELVFESLASIKDDIDTFFDKIMVMVDDERVRANRLALLNSVRDLYFKIADLSKLAI